MALNENWRTDRLKYTGRQTIDKYLDDGTITPDDVNLIDDYLIHRRAQSDKSELSPSRTMLIESVLCYWRKYLRTPYRDATFSQIEKAIDTFKKGTYASTAKGHEGEVKKYRQNTKQVYVAILKSFLLWMIEEKYSNIDYFKAKRIKVPKIDTNTTAPHQVLTEDDVKKIMNTTVNPMHRALFAVAFESGARPQELADATWRDFKEDEYGYAGHVQDFKTKKPRFVRLRWSAGYLSDWRQVSKWTRPDDFIFTTQRGKGMAYKTALCLFQDKAKQAGLYEAGKQIKLYANRKGRINDMIAKNVPSDAIMHQIWGNPSSRMLKTYSAQTDQQIDNKLLEHSGVKPASSVESVLRDITCPHCGESNRALAERCSRCGEALSERAKQAAAEARAQKQSLEDEIEARLVKITEMYDKMVAQGVIKE